MDSSVVLKYVVPLLTLWTSVAPSVEEMREYCQWEIFNATCEPDEIILMTHAEYGRMRLGRCLTTDVYIGCGANVLEEIDAKCSGRQSCQLQLPDSSLHKKQPCPDDMVAYLEASYTCVKVSIVPEGHHCSSVAALPPVSNQSGVLSSAVARATQYGMPTCPWAVAVLPGQNIRVTLLDFGLTSRYHSETWNAVPEDGEYCFVYAIIREKDGKEFTVCAGSKREDTVYVSTSNQITIILLDGDDDDQNFLIKYEAIGCPDIQAPTNAYAIRQGDGATITCNATTQAWHLVCKDTDWVGEYGECTAGAAAPPPGEEQIIPSYGLILAILIGVAIGVLVGFALLLAVLWCRRQRRDKRSDDQCDDPNGRMTTIPMTSSAPGTPTCKVHRLKGEYGYTHVWEVAPGTAGVLPQGTTTTYRPGPPGTNTPDSAYQSYQSHRSGQPDMVCFHPKRDQEYECPKFETFGLGRDTMFPRPLYQGCGKTCTMKPTKTTTGQCGDSLDSVVHIEVGLDPSSLRSAPVSVGGPATTCYSMAGDTSRPAVVTDNPNNSTTGPVAHDNGTDPRGNHYT